VTTPIATEREANGQLAVLAVAMVLAMTTWFAAAAVIGELREEFDLTRTSGAWLTIAVQIGFVVGAVASAALNLADLVPSRRLVLVGALVAATANLTLLVAPTLPVAIAGRAATGAGLALVYPPALKAAAVWFLDRRGLALGVMVGALTVGSALPHLVAALGGIGWEATIVVTSVTTVAGGLVAEFVARDGPYPFRRGDFDVRRVLVVVRNRDLRLATLGYFGHMWELYAMWSWFAVFYSDALERRGFDNATQVASVVTFAVIGVGGLGSIAGGLVSDRWGREVAAGSALTVSGAVAVFIGFVIDAHPVLIAAAGLVWGFAVVADSAQFSTIVSERADEASVGTALTTQLASGFVLTVFTIFLVPVVEEAYGWGWAFLLLAPGPALGAWAMYRLRAPDRRSAIAPSQVGPG